jgi:hypothetical protein
MAPKLDPFPFSCEQDMKENMPSNPEQVVVLHMGG